MFDDIHNFRKVAELKLYRSATLDNASKEDVQKLVALDIKSLIDFRGQKEIDSSHCVDEVYKAETHQSDNPDEVDPGVEDFGICRDARKRFHAPLPGHGLLSPGYLEMARKVEGFDRLQDPVHKMGFILKKIINPIKQIGLYTNMISQFGDSFVYVLKLLCEPSNVPSLIYCKHGKDRTGITVALIQYIFGHTEDEICTEYAKTQAEIENHEKFSEDIKRDFSRAALIDPTFLTANYSTMKEVLEFINNQYGSVGKYLDTYGFDETWREKLRKNLSE